MTVGVTAVATEIVLTGISIIDRRQSGEVAIDGCVIGREQFTTLGLTEMNEEARTFSGSR